MNQSCTVFGIILLLITTFPLDANPEETEARLQALEIELDLEQEALNERRRDLELRKLQLKLRKEGRDVPTPDTELNLQDRAALLTRLQTLATAEKTRADLLVELEKIGEALVNLKKGDDRVGSPRAFGPKAKALEQTNQQARLEIETRSQELKTNILTSMQTTLKEKGGLNDAELEWLQSQTVRTDDETSAIDEATFRWMETILKMEKERRNPQHDTTGVKRPPALVD